MQAANSTKFYQKPETAPTPHALAPHAAKAKGMSLGLKQAIESELKSAKSREEWQAMKLAFQFALSGQHLKTSFLFPLQRENLPEFMTECGATESDRTKILAFDSAVHLLLRGVSPQASFEKEFSKASESDRAEILSEIQNTLPYWYEFSISEFIRMTEAEQKTVNREEFLFYFENFALAAERNSLFNQRSGFLDAAKHPDNCLKKLFLFFFSNSCPFSEDVQKSPFFSKLAKIFCSKTVSIALNRLENVYEQFFRICSDESIVKQNEKALNSFMLSLVKEIQKNPKIKKEIYQGHIEQFESALGAKQIPIKEKQQDEIQTDKPPQEAESEIQPQGEYAEYSQEKLNAVLKLQNWFRTIESYSRMSQGSLYGDIKYPKPEDGSQSKREDALQKRLQDIFSGLPSGTEKGGTSAAIGLPEKLSYEDFRRFKTLSARNLAALRALVSKDRAALEDIHLLDFIQKFCESKFCLVHFTTAKSLENRSLLSLRALLSKEFVQVHQSWNEQGKFGIEIAGTPLEDMEILGDTGFVFFHFQPPNSAHKVQSKFGTEFYSIPVTAKDLQEKSILLTLADAGAGGMATFRESSLFKAIFVSPHLKYAYQEVEDSVSYFFNVAIEEAFRQIGPILDKTQLFVRNDILPGIALCIVHLFAVFQKKYENEYGSIEKSYAGDPRDYAARQKFHMQQSKAEIIKRVIADLEAFLKSDLKDNEKLNALINGWIRPFAKVPGGITPQPEMSHETVE